MAVRPFLFTSTRCQFKLGTAYTRTHSHTGGLVCSPISLCGKVFPDSFGETGRKAAKNFASQTFLHIFSTKRMLVFHVCWLISFWGFRLGFSPPRRHPFRATAPGGHIHLESPLKKFKCFNRNLSNWRRPSRAKKFLPLELGHCKRLICQPFA